jgi:hypothetical protein
MRVLTDGLGCRSATGGGVVLYLFGGVEKVRTMKKFTIDGQEVEAVQQLKDGASRW